MQFATLINNFPPLFFLAPSSRESEQGGVLPSPLHTSLFPEWDTFLVLVHPPGLDSAISRKSLPDNICREKVATKASKRANLISAVGSFLCRTQRHEELLRNVLIFRFQSLCHTSRQSGERGRVMERPRMTLLAPGGLLGGHWRPASRLLTSHSHLRRSKR